MAQGNGTGNSNGNGTRPLADQIIAMVAFNRAEIDGLTYGQIVLDVYEGRLVEVKTASSLRLAKGQKLSSVTLRNPGLSP